MRLAAKIVGWRIDIKSEEEKRQEVEAEMARMERIVAELRSLEEHGVSDKVAQSLIDAGVAGLAHILEMTDEDLQQVEGVGVKTAEKIREAASAAKVDWDRKDAEEAARVEAASRRSGGRGAGGRRAAPGRGAGPGRAGRGGGGRDGRRGRRRRGRGAGRTGGRIRRDGGTRHAKRGGRVARG